jgi:hypothetical protein
MHPKQLDFYTLDYLRIKLRDSPLPSLCNNSNNQHPRSQVVSVCLVVVIFIEWIIFGMVSAIIIIIIIAVITIPTTVLIVMVLLFLLLLLLLVMLTGLVRLTVHDLLVIIVLVSLLHLCLFVLPLFIDRRLTTHVVVPFHVAMEVCVLVMVVPAIAIPMVTVVLRLTDNMPVAVGTMWMCVCM